MRSLRIVHTESSCAWGGQEIRTLTEAQGMIRRGHSVTLICAPESRIFHAAPRYQIDAAALPIARKRLDGLFALRRWLAEHRSDLVNTHSSTDSWLVALASATLRRAPLVLRTRHVSSPVGKDLLTFWLYQHSARHIVTTGEALRMQLQRDNGFDPSTLTSVPTGIDLERFVPGDAAGARARLGLPERPAVGILATLRNWKGHVYLLRALALLRARHPRWQLLVIGDGPQRRNLDALIGELALADSVHMVGEQDDPAAWLRALDIAALPSYGDEGVPQSILQAMACGLPVVSTPVGGISEAVIDGETGLLVAARNETALAAALERLMSDPALRRRMGEAGLALARERFGLERMLDRMEAVYARMLGNAD